MPSHSVSGLCSTDDRTAERVERVHKCDLTCRSFGMFMILILMGLCFVYGVCRYGWREIC